jgi:hypothetical protein
MGMAIPRDVLRGGSANGTAVTRKGRIEKTKEWKRCIWKIGNVQIGYKGERNGTVDPDGKPDTPCMLLYVAGGRFRKLGGSMPYSMSAEVRVVSR